MERDHIAGFKVNRQRQSVGASPSLFELFVSEDE
jgi:hypothetical protein